MATKVENLKVYQKALTVAGEVSAIIRRASFANDRRLRAQLGASSERVASLISEGSEQSTDRHFAEYCYRSKGSAREMRTQLLVAVQRAHMTEKGTNPSGSLLRGNLQDAERL